MKNKSPFVSIITPVYNGDKYLTECIESVLAQTYSHWEYVIVNNCSTDRSLEIAEKYAAQDSRIRVHTYDEHLQVMQSLNQSFKQMTPDSKYCKVIHADDWMFPRCLELMVENAEEFPTIGMVMSYRLVETMVENDGLPYPSHFVPGREICRKFLLHGKSYFGAPSNLLLRSDLVRKRDKLYDESYLQSDMSACLDILQESDYGFVHQVLTFTRRHKNSVTETYAKKNLELAYGYLKMHLDYFSLYLTDDEVKRRIAQRIDVFYKLFARNLIHHKSGQVFRVQKEQLESTGVSFKYHKIAGAVVVESLKMIVEKLIKVFGYELKRAGSTS